MTLTPKFPSALPFEPVSLASGAHAFQVRGGKGRESKLITVDYHLPKTFTPLSPILLVVPGAGRNGVEYLLPWIETAEARGVLVASLTYPEADYDFAAYQMGGVIKNLVIRNMPRGPSGAPPDVVHLRDEDITFEPVVDPDAWIFPDFDRVFALLKAQTRSARESYDIFGHSAGAQILHRLAIFRPRSKASRVVAANCGFYSQPNVDLPLPAGLRGTGVTAGQLGDAFAVRLALLVGELDKNGEEGGMQIHTPILDSYGVDRLARARTFFENAKRAAAAAKAPFNWEFQTVPGVAHDFRGVTAAASKLLYG